MSSASGPAMTSRGRPVTGLIGLLGACHPVPTLAVTVVSVLLAAGVGLGAGTVVLVGAAVLTGQLSIGWSNDSIDAARDADAGRGDKPVAAGRLTPRAVGVAAALALVVSAVLSGLLGLPAAAAALTLVAAGWAYNLGLKATVLSGATYLVGFGALPAVAYLARPGHDGPPWWVIVTGALLGFGAHFANVLPDLRDDAATGVRGLPHRLGPRVGVLVMAGALALASIVLAVGPNGSSTAFAVTAASIGVLGAVTVAIAAAVVPDGPVAFRLTLGLALVDVALVIALAT